MDIDTLLKALEKDENEAIIDMRKRKKYIKFVSCDISIIYSVTSLLN